MADKFDCTNNDKSTHYDEALAIAFAPMFPPVKKTERGQRRLPETDKYIAYGYSSTSMYNTRRDILGLANDPNE
jgi:hypothetical protein